MSAYMQRVLGYSALTTGLAFLPMAAVILIMSNVASWLVARLGVKVFLVGGLAVLSLVCFCSHRFTRRGPLLAPSYLASLSLLSV
jgi:Na+/melibiose symporter-like transporter